MYSIERSSLCSLENELEDIKYAHCNKHFLTFHGNTIPLNFKNVFRLNSSKKKIRMLNLSSKIRRFFIKKGVYGSFTRFFFFFLGGGDFPIKILLYIHCKALARLFS